MRLVGRMRVDFARTRTALGTVFRNLTPVVAGRGASQISGYVDNLLASLLPTGAVSALSYASILYLLPISLFGMSVAAAELPSMSRAAGTFEEISQLLRLRLDAGLRQIAFLVVPSAAAFLFLGDVVSALIFQSGSFTHGDAIYVWAVLAGSAVGMLAATMGRLYNSAFYALEDTRTPLKFALIRFTLTLVFGYLCAIPLPPAIGNRPALGRDGPDRVGRSCRMGRIRAPAMETQLENRSDRIETRTRGAVVGDRAGGDRGRMGGEARHGARRTAADGARGAARLRRGLSRAGVVDAATGA